MAYFMSWKFRLLSFAILVFLQGSFSVSNEQEKWEPAIVDSLHKIGIRNLSSLRLINEYIPEQNGSASLYFTTFDLSVKSCNKTLVNCKQIEFVCELLIDDDPAVGEKIVVNDATVCAEKEIIPSLPVYEQGFTDVEIDSDIKNVAEFAVRSIQNNDLNKTITDIFSAKKQIAENSTLLFLTAKLIQSTAGEESVFEVCEIELNQTGETAVVTNFHCFNLADTEDQFVNQSDDEMRSLASDIVSELDTLTASKFSNELTDVIKAETTVTPGSRAVLTSMEIRMLPTLCLKTNSAVDSAIPRVCPINNASVPVRCIVYQWDRPWTPDSLYSTPLCHVETTLLNMESSTTSTFKLESDVETLATVMEDESKFLVPAIEDPIVVKQTFCTGCPTDLSVDNEVFRDFTDQALSMIDEASSTPFKHMVTRIFKAQKQIVNGIKYTLFMEVSETACPKRSNQSDIGICLPSPQGNVRVCVAEFLVMPWIPNHREVLSNNCTHGDGPYFDNNDLDNEIEPRFPADADGHQELDYMEAVEGRNMFAFLSSGEGLNNKVTESSKEGGSTESSTAGPYIVNLDLVDPNNTSNSDSNENEQFTNSNSNSRSKRDIAEEDRKIGPHEQRDILNSESEFVKKLADISIQTLNDIDPDGNKRVILEVLEAKKRLEDGITYKLKLIVGSSSPECADSNAESLNCLEQQALAKECDVQLRRSFAVNSENNIQVISATCTQLPQESRKNVLKRSQKLVGGLTQKNPDDTYIKEIASFAHSQIEAQRNDQASRKLINVTSAATQVVAGVKIYLRFMVGTTHCSKYSSGSGNCQVQGTSDLQTCNAVVLDSLGNAGKTLVNWTCENLEDRKKRETDEVIPGGFMEEDVNSVEVRETADFALSKLNQQSDSPYRKKVIEITHAKSQIVAGKKYILTLRLADTDCTKESSDSDACSPKDDNHNECTVTVWDRPWLEERRLLLNVTCSTSNSRRKRETEPAILGGFKEEDVNSVAVKETVDFALEKLNLQSDSQYRKKVIEITHAKSQVVAGKKYILTLRLADTDCSKESPDSDTCSPKDDNQKECTVTVWDRPWLEERRLLLNVTCDTSNSRRKRNDNEIGLRGAYRTAEVNDEKIKEVANYAVSALDSQSNSMYTRKVAEILSAAVQVVAGTNYKLRLRLVTTNCVKSAAVQSVCDSAGDYENLDVCEVVIWKNLSNELSLTNSSCGTSLDRKKRNDHLLGGYAPVDVNRDDVKEIAEYYVSTVTRESGTPNAKKVVEIIKAETQVVEGINYKIQLKLAETNCASDVVDLTTCEASNDEDKQEICEIVVWKQLGPEKPKAITSTKCNTELTRKKRNVRPLTGHLIGAPAEANTNDSYIQDLLNSAVSRIDASSNALYSLQLVHVLKATKQIVSGTLVSFDIELGYTNCRKSHGKTSDGATCELSSTSKNQICHIEVWDQPWLKKRTYDNISCKPVSNNVRRRRDIPQTDGPSYEAIMFREFMQKFNKNYKSSLEFKRRFHIFKANMKKAQALQRTEQGSATYGVTQFSDLTATEFKKNYLGLNPKMKHPNTIPMKEAKIPNVKIPMEFDWRHYNTVTPVKNQGSCGSCWAFSVTGNIEGQWALRTGNLLSLSEQELVDCDTLDDGCKGGLPENAYHAIEQLGGLETEKDYPYEGDDERCHFNKSEVQVTITGAVNISRNETEMAQWLYKNGPISIGINANAMQFYIGGVSHPWKFLCNPSDLDHGVLIVGYGVHTYPMFHKTLPYWLVKNSWGESWGEQGYYRVYRGDGTCGVNQMATSATVN